MLRSRKKKRVYTDFYNREPYKKEEDKVEKYTLSSIIILPISKIIDRGVVETWVRLKLS